jgi:hypothetical protein
MSMYPTPGADKAQLESQFLKIKSKLARQHKVMQETLGADYQLGGGTMNIVAGATSLESIYSQSEVSVKKLQTEWHRAFIEINGMLGVLEDKKSRAEAGEKIFIAQGADAGGGGGGVGGGMNKNSMIAVIAILVIGGLVAAFFFTPLGAWYKSMIGG